MSFHIFGSNHVFFFSKISFTDGWMDRCVWWYRSGYQKWPVMFFILLVRFLFRQNQKRQINIFFLIKVKDHASQCVQPYKEQKFLLINQHDFRFYFVDYNKIVGFSNIERYAYIHSKNPYKISWPVTFSVQSYFSLRYVGRYIFRFYFRAVLFSPIVEGVLFAVFIARNENGLSLYSIVTLK